MKHQFLHFSTALLVAVLPVWAFAQCVPDVTVSVVHPSQMGCFDGKIIVDCTPSGPWPTAMITYGATGNQAGPTTSNYNPDLGYATHYEWHGLGATTYGIWVWGTCGQFYVNSSNSATLLNPPCSPKSTVTKTNPTGIGCSNGTITIHNGYACSNASISVYKDGYWLGNWPVISPGQDLTMPNLSAGNYAISFGDYPHGSCPETHNVTLSDPPAFTINRTETSDISNCANLKYTVFDNFDNACGTVVAELYDLETTPPTLLASGGISDGIGHTFEQLSANNSYRIKYFPASNPASSSVQSTFALSLPAEVCDNIDNDCDGLIDETVPTVSFQTVKPSCVGGSDGRITANPTSPVSGYEYSWDNGATNRAVTGLAAGTYTVTVTKIATGCTVIGTAIVVDPPTLVVDLTKRDVKCFGGTDGSIAAKGTGGSGTKTYQWSTGSTLYKIQDLPAGTYTITVTDSKGCTTSAEATVTEPPVLTLSHTVETLPNGKFRVTLAAAGGTPYPTGDPYKYCRVSATGSCGFTSNDMYTIAAAGTYTFRARDKNGCIASIDVTLPPTFGSGETEERGSGFTSNLSATGFALSPNPFDNQLIIKSDKLFGGGTARILDASGRLVLEKIWPTNAAVLTVEGTADWPPGVFFVQITDTTGKAHTNLKAVKAH